MMLRSSRLMMKSRRRGVYSPSCTRVWNTTSVPMQAPPPPGAPPWWIIMALQLPTGGETVTPLSVGWRAILAQPAPQLEVLHQACPVSSPSDTMVSPTPPALQTLLASLGAPLPPTVMVPTSKARASMDCAPPHVQELRLWLLSVFLAPPGPRSATPASAAPQGRPSALPPPAGPPHAPLGPPGVLSATPVFVAAQENLFAPRICAQKGVWWRQDLIRGLSVSSHSVGEERPTGGAHHGHMVAHSRTGVGALPKLMRRDCM